MVLLRGLCGEGGGGVGKEREGADGVAKRNGLLGYKYLYGPGNARRLLSRPIGATLLG